VDRKILSDRGYISDLGDGRGRNWQEMGEHGALPEENTGRSFVGEGKVISPGGGKP